MPDPDELSPEECAAAALLLEAEFREADQRAATIFAMQDMISEASDEELRTRLPEHQADIILAYRKGPIHDITVTAQDTDDPISWLGRTFDYVQRLFGPVNGISQPLIGRGFAGGPSRPQVRMRHVGHPDDELVIFRFSRPIREAILAHGDNLLFRGLDLAADVHLEIWSRDVVRNPSDSPIRWQFIEGLEWRINWDE